MPHFWYEFGILYLLVGACFVLYMQHDLKSIGSKRRIVEFFLMIGWLPIWLLAIYRSIRIAYLRHKRWRKK